MVIGYHLIWTAYGWWLPMTRVAFFHEIRVERIADLGELHHGRKLFNRHPRGYASSMNEARGVLKHPLLTFDRAAVEVIAAAFAETIIEQRYTCYSCAIMPDHVHVLIRKHRDQAEKMIRAISMLLANPIDREQPSRPDPSRGVAAAEGLSRNPRDRERTDANIRDNPVKIDNLDKNGNSSNSMTVGSRAPPFLSLRFPQNPCPPLCRRFRV